MKVRELRVITGNLFFLLTAVVGFSQSDNSKTEQKPSLPKVFLLGEYEEVYEEIVPDYVSLLDACDGDMDVAFDKLMNMMLEMEDYAASSGFDLKDVSAWMYFFWRKDGTIEHIGYHLRPNSKNVNLTAFKNFLTGFSKQYKFPLSDDKKYSHYSTFSFPVVYKKAGQGTNTARNN